MQMVSDQDRVAVQADPETLLEWRKSKGLLQEEAGALVGVSKVSWGNWENFRKPPMGENLKKLRTLTGLSFEQILEPPLAGTHPHDPASDELAADEAGPSSAAPFRKAG